MMPQRRSRVDVCRWVTVTLRVMKTLLLCSPEPGWSSGTFLISFWICGRFFWGCCLATASLTAFIRLAVDFLIFGCCKTAFVSCDVIAMTDTNTVLHHLRKYYEISRMPLLKADSDTLLLSLWFFVILLAFLLWKSVSRPITIYFFIINIYAPTIHLISLWNL